MANVERIKRDLMNRKIGTNCQGRNHIIKVICGRGNHSNDQAPERVGALRKFFLQFLTNSDYDFAYIEKNGCFLIRIRV
jgi:hypothetical protein